MIVPLPVPPFQFGWRASALQTAVLCWLDSSNEARDDGGGVWGALDIAIRKSAKEVAQAASMRHIVVDPPRVVMAPEARRGAGRRTRAARGAKRTARTCRRPGAPLDRRTGT